MWYDESIMYQIYPLGYVGAPECNDGVVEHRILKIKEHIPHFVKLGCNLIYFCPILRVVNMAMIQQIIGRWIVG